MKCCNIFGKVTIGFGIVLMFVGAAIVPSSTRVWADSGEPGLGGCRSSCNQCGDFWPTLNFCKNSQGNQGWCNTTPAGYCNRCTDCFRDIGVDNNQDGYDDCGCLTT